MTPEELIAQVHAEPKCVIPNRVISESHCKKVVVRTHDGRIFNLGNPQSLFFSLRRAWYLWRRRGELKGASYG